MPGVAVRMCEISQWMRTLVADVKDSLEGFLRWGLTSLEEPEAVQWIPYIQVELVVLLSS